MAMSNVAGTNIHTMWIRIGFEDSTSFSMLHSFNALKTLYVFFTLSWGSRSHDLRPLYLPNVEVVTLIWKEEGSQHEADYIFSCRFRRARSINISFPKLTPALARGFTQFLEDRIHPLKSMTLECPSSTISMLGSILFRCTQFLHFQGMVPPADIIRSDIWSFARVTRITMQSDVEGERLWALLTAMVDATASNKLVAVYPALSDSTLFRWNARQPDARYAHFVGAATYFALALLSKNIILMDAAGEGLCTVGPRELVKKMLTAHVAGRD
jgi:hypothetical protein